MPSMFLSLPPSPALADFVRGYWFVEDIPGVHEGTPIRTSPHPGAILSVNFGRPNAVEGGPTVPQVSLLGVQSEGRRWQSWSETYFVMVMMTCLGLARLFPRVGIDCKDRLVDVGALLGDGLAQGLSRDLSAAWVPHRVARQLDVWLLERLERVEAPRELRLLAKAQELLRTGVQVEEAAHSVEVSRRQLTRWFERHIGMNPKQVMVLERLQSSLASVQRGKGNAMLGYSDQAHQIRSWQRRLNVTPGRYARGGLSPAAEYFASTGSDGPAFYL